MTTRPTSRTFLLLGGLLALYLAVPLGAFLIRLGRGGSTGIGAAGLFPALAVSATTATISALLIAAFGLPLAYALARSTGRFATAVGLVAQLPLALPPLMSGILLIYVVGPYSALGRFFGGRLTESIAGVVLAQTFVAAPFLVAVARSAFSEIDPALFDLAATLGHREISTFFNVALPGARRGVRAGLLLAWLRAFGEYGATAILAYHPYSLPVFTYLQFSGAGLENTEAPTALALGVAGIVVLLAHYLPMGSVRKARVPSTPVLEPDVGLPEVLDFSLALTLGDFEMRLAHRSSHAHIAILGPSGAGKSVTLRAIAGFFGPDVGPVRFGGELVSPIAVSERNVGYVPQSGSLFPARSVWQQVTFGVDTDPRLARYWLERLGLAALVERLPAELSGGERQRVHLAAALARSPRLLLLDEPFSALDVPVRESLRREFRRLQREAGLSTVLVTHDPEEAAALADEIIVIAAGVVLQAGPRAEVFRRPASAEVARLLGISNILPGRMARGTLRAGNIEIGAVGHATLEGDVTWCVSAADVRVAPDGALSGVIDDIIDRGLTSSAVIGIGGGGSLVAHPVDQSGLELGAICRFDLDAASVTYWVGAVQVQSTDC